ncbi:MAG: hypothetical protein Q9160_007405 [Pyrenula sp. 1 TL-2023]
MAEGNDPLAETAGDEHPDRYMGPSRRDHGSRGRKRYRPPSTQLDQLTGIRAPVHPYSSRGLNQHLQRRPRERAIWDALRELTYPTPRPDSYAYFALGIRLIQDPTPFIVQESGALKARDNKRSVPIFEGLAGIPRRWIG